MYKYLFYSTMRLYKLVYRSYGIDAQTGTELLLASSASFNTIFILVLSRILKFSSIPILSAILIYLTYYIIFKYLNKRIIENEKNKNFDISTISLIPALLFNLIWMILFIFVDFATYK
jgi:hypothetical protein